MDTHIFSDLHFEHMSKDYKKDFWDALEYSNKQFNPGLLILAGDIGQIGGRESKYLEDFIQLCSYYKHVIYVPGNHEYYGTDFDEVNNYFYPHLIDTHPLLKHAVNLNDGPYTLDNQRFIGGTMWFPQSNLSITEQRRTKRLMSDFSAISNFEPEVYNLHQQFLNNSIAKVKSTDIVITHHLPLNECVAPKYMGSPINQYFVANDIEQYLNEGNLPKMWIFGHTHEPINKDFIIGRSTMVLYSNPGGYPFEGVNPKLWSRSIAFHDVI